MTTTDTTSTIETKGMDEILTPEVTTTATLATSATTSMPETRITITALATMNGITKSYNNSYNNRRDVDHAREAPIKNINNGNNYA